MADSARLRDSLLREALRRLDMNYGAQNLRRQGFPEDAGATRQEKFILIVHLRHCGNNFVHTFALHYDLQ